jgi:hypothetical protein
LVVEVVAEKFTFSESPLVDLSQFTVLLNFADQEFESIFYRLALNISIQRVSQLEAFSDVKDLLRRLFSIELLV